VVVEGWKFADFWIWSSIALYIIIQIIVIGFAGPILGNLQGWVSAASIPNTLF
jgi:hypothetical protein